MRRKRMNVLAGDSYPITRILDERLAELCASSGFAKIVGNEKLACLARKIIIKGKSFDYPTLKVV